MWRGRGVAHSVQSERGSSKSLQLSTFVQSQQAWHLARLQEVKVMWSSGGSGPIALHALQLLAHCHHVQLHILGLLLMKQHLAEEEVNACFFHSEGAPVFIVPHCFSHIQCPLFPAFDYSTVTHLLRGHFGNFKMRRCFFSIPALPRHPSVSLDSLADQQLSFLQNELNDRLPLCINLLEPVLQDFKGLREVSCLAPGPRREERTARGQGQCNKRQGSPHEPQFTHPSPLHNPMHSGCRDCTTTRHHTPNQSPTSSP